MALGMPGFLLLLLLVAAVMVVLLLITAGQNRKYVSKTDQRLCRHCGCSHPVMAQFCRRCGKKL